VAGAIQSRINVDHTATVFNDEAVDIDFRVESVNQANMLKVDAATDFVSIGGLGEQANGGALNINAVSGSAVFGMITRSATDGHTNIINLQKTPATSGNYTATASGDVLGEIRFSGVNTSAVGDIGVHIKAIQSDTASGTVPTDLHIDTNEINRLSITLAEIVLNDGGNDVDFRVEGSGQANLFVVDAGLGTGKVGVGAAPTDLFYVTGAASATAMGVRIGTNGFNGIEFDNATGSLVGRITVNSSATAYVTSSDYRLKENIADMTGATARLKQLKPKRFNWITDDTNTLIDGFLAHEVTAIVPEAVAGEKDAVHPDGHHEAGEIDPQGLDYSKLVPLLVKTIQELEARIKTLEDA